MPLPTDNKLRKMIRAFQGFVCYFPDAIAACANLSRIANEQHNPGERMHWAKEKSTDELDSLMNHLLDIAAKGPESRDADGILDAVKVFWRAGANLQRLADSGVDIINVPPKPLFIHDEISWPVNPELLISTLQRCEGHELKIDEAHKPTIDEIIDMERSPYPPAPLHIKCGPEKYDGPWDVVFTDDMDHGLEGETRRGPYETIEECEDYAQRNPERISGLKSIQPSTCKVRNDHA